VLSQFVIGGWILTSVSNDILVLSGVHTVQFSHVLGAVVFNRSHNARQVNVTIGKCFVYYFHIDRMERVQKKVRWICVTRSEVNRRTCMIDVL
jgi:hypothetical protein